MTTEILTPPTTTSRPSSAGAAALRITGMACRNCGHTQQLDIAYVRSTHHRAEWQAPKRIWQGRGGDLLSVIQLRSGRLLLPISYRTHRRWANRGSGQMMVWIPNSEASARPAAFPTVATTAKITVSSNPHGHNPANINDGEDPSATGLVEIESQPGTGFAASSRTPERTSTSSPS